MHWADPARPPANTVPYSAAALAAITGEAAFPSTAGDTARTFPLLDHARAFAVMPKIWQNGLPQSSQHRLVHPSALSWL
jgi:hypothetical protein